MLNGLLNRALLVLRDARKFVENQKNAPLLCFFAFFSAPCAHQASCRSGSVFLAKFFFSFQDAFFGAA
jgi:hypothetical protein